jgi:hypothetical protein
MEHIVTAPMRPSPLNSLTRCDHRFPIVITIAAFADTEMVAIRNVLLVGKSESVTG